MAKKPAKKPTAKPQPAKKPKVTMPKARPVATKPAKPAPKATKAPAPVAKTVAAKAKPVVVVKAAPEKAPVSKIVTSKPVVAKPAVVAKPPAAKVVVAKPIGKSGSQKLGSTHNGSAKSEVVIARPANPSPATKVVGPVKIVKAKKLKKPLKHVDVQPVKLPPPPVTSDSKMAKNRAGLMSRELEHFRSLLLEKRRELLGDVTSMERDALRSGNTNLSNLPLHMADTGTDNYEQEFTLGLVEKDRQLLREINNALAKIQDGSYGTCEGTGKPIAKPRLEAQPWARHSIEYARQMEKPQFRRAY